MSPFPGLFSSCRIGGLNLKNRLVLPPMGTCLGGMDGSVTREMEDYYSCRAGGGVGLVIVENTLVDDTYGIQIANQLRMTSHHAVPFLYRLTEQIKEKGARVAVQINVAGCGTRRHLAPGVKPTGPSAVAYDFQPERCRRLAVSEIRAITKAFARGAVLARLAGFDAVEVHGANGYLLNQFLSPYSNRRRDAYGGTLEKRLRFPLEVIRGIRDEVGEDYPVLFRLSVDEFLEGGLTLEHAVEIARRLEKAGVDGLDVTAGNLNARGSCARAIPSQFIPHGHLAAHAAALRQSVNIPVILAGKIKTPELAEEMVHSGVADLVAVGRGLLADPKWPRKASRGLPGEIRKCISCNEMCLYQKTWQSRPIRCTVNPLLGREGHRIERSEHPKRILVVGGGPAGAEAARSCALKGHAVTLCEKEGRLGGQLWMASVLPFKSELRDLIGQMEIGLQNLGVEVRLNEEVKEALSGEPGFDEVIVATGAAPLLPSLPGIEGVHAISYDEALLGKGREVRGEHVVVAGGGLIGCETAIHITQTYNKKVFIIEKQNQIANEIEPIFNRDGLIQSIRDKKISILTEHEITGIEDHQLKAFYRKREVSVRVDTLVLALGRVKVKPPLEVFHRQNVPVHYVGDCIEPRKLSHAIHEGFWTGAGI
ncbi:MAG: FAD-dependent oxidoreductase [Deltaproteobacteria bacterium]|nr:FAD-dependent oxidoreductase [Deltaproteobacteria bacterium]